MSAAGWIMMTGSWLFIGGLTLFCIRKVIRLTLTQAEHIRPIIEIDTGDQKEE
ncbi:MAG: hypothetical protein HQK87_05025 [Nitrospinae bacterium]|nr:hypothetical protein [Nitrospinota bacterium]